MANRSKRDDPQCEHGPLDVIVTNQPEFDATRPHRAVWVCERPECVLDAMAWVRRGTGEKPWWREGTTGPWSAGIYERTAA